MVGVLLCNANVVMKLVSMAVVCSVIDSCVCVCVRTCVPVKSVYGSVYIQYVCHAVKVLVIVSS